MKNYLLWICLLLGHSINAQHISDSLARREHIVPDASLKKPIRAWIKPAIAGGYIGLTFFCYRFVDKKVQRFSQQNKAGVPDFISKSVTHLGLDNVQTLGIATTSIIALIEKNVLLKKTVIIWAGSMMINGVITDQLKMAFQRHRPNTGDPYDTFRSKGSTDHSSFPSAHTSNAFTTATVFADIYKNKKWVAPVAYGLATLVGLSRVHDNAHWASDVMAGAAIGFFSARATSGIYKLLGKKLLFLPGVQGSHNTLSVVCSF